MAPTSTPTAALAGQDAPPPVQQDAPETPDMSGALSNDSMPAPFSQRVGQGANDLTQQQTPEQAAKPGAWARSLLGGVVGALSGFVAGGGVGPQQAEIAQRNIAERNRQRQQQVENQQKQQQMGREEAIARATIAHENASTLYDEMNASTLSYKNQLQGVETGKAALKIFTDAGAPIIQEGIDGNEANQLVREKKLSPTQQHIYPSGQAPVPGMEGKTDKAGNPLMQNTYTVIGDTPSVTLDDATSKLINENTAYKLPPGTTMPGIPAHTVITQAKAAQTAKMLADEQVEEAGIKKGNLDLDAATQKFMGASDGWGTAMAKSKQNVRSALNHIETDTNLRQKYPNAAAMVARIYGGQDKLDTVEDQQETERQKQEELNQKEGGAPAGNTPTTPAMVEAVKGFTPDKQAILKRFDPDMQATLLAVGTGEQDFNKVFPQRLTKGAPGIDKQTAAGVLEQLFPGYDPTRAPIYQKARQDFSPDGSAGKGIMAINTAIPHLADFHRSASYAAVLPGVSGVARALGNQSAKDYQVSLTALSNELATAYKGGAATDQEIKEWRKTLDGSTPAEVRNGTQAALHKLQAKLQSYKDQWVTSSVPGTQPPMNFESKGATESADKIMGVPSAQMVTLKAPNGQTKQVPADQADHYKSLGATIVTQ